MEFHVLVREPVGGEVGVLVLLHGYGADEKDLMGITPALDPSLRILSVRAPHTTPMGGYAWFGIEFDTAIRSYDMEQAARSLDGLVGFLDELRAEFTGPMALAGFSQGAMMAHAAISRKPSLADSAALMSGKVLPSLLPAHAPDGIADVRFLVQHGTDDPLLPVACGRELKAHLEAWGVQPTYREYPMGHSISDQSLNDLSGWLSAV